MSLAIPSSNLHRHVTSHHPVTLSKRYREGSPIKEIQDWINANGLNWWRVPSCIYLPLKINEIMPECQASEDGQILHRECEYKPYEYEEGKCWCDSGSLSRKKESYEWETQCVDARCGEKDGWWLKCTHLRRQKDLQEACGIVLPKAREKAVDDYGEKVAAEIDAKYPYDEEQERIEIPSVCDQFPTTAPSETESAGPRTTIKINSDGTTTTVEISSSTRTSRLQQTAVLTILVSSLLAFTTA
ncbi:hypothetical protein BKA70DRAFT_1426446 [Coprinopsis sp. MPI-PUGE-AT-0042]|nr:hypothetical protein BKA70DRAFT_1426446 [Coprinopsis sp. MPI-PUGE-AT-0042]